MRWRRWCWAGLTGLGLASSASGQAPALPTPTLTNLRSFGVPFQVDPIERPRLKEVQLYQSADRGRTWRQETALTPEKEFFTFHALTDGEYWFAVRTVDKEGRAFPSAVTGMTPGLIVILDTVTPVVDLRGLNLGGDQAGVAWQITDEHLDPTTMKLEYASAGSNQWQSVPFTPAPIGEAKWRAGVPGPVDVQLRVLDKAGNTAGKKLTLSSPGALGPTAQRGYPAGPTPAVGPTSGGGFNVPGPPSFDRNAIGPVNNPPAPFPGVAPPANGAVPGLVPPAQRAPDNTILVNSTRFGLEYRKDLIGKSGLSAVSLYWTTDGQTWHYYGDDDDKESPFQIEVNGEGVYGLSLIAKSGAGFGEQPPEPGAPPQSWVEVDITPPLIKLAPTEVGSGSSAGILSIQWTAQDKNLAPKCISLFYGESASGPWISIAKDLENTGRYQWRMALDEIPYKFYVRAEARDRAGNVGREETDRPVIVDLARPKVSITGIKTSAGGATPTPTPTPNFVPEPPAPNALPQIKIE